MSKLEIIFFWVSVFLYAPSALCYIGAFTLKKEMFYKWGKPLLLLAFAAHTLAILIRWQVTGHLPVMREYENVLAAAWMVTLFYVIMQLKWPWTVNMGIFIVPFSLLMMGLGYSAKATLEPLTLPFQSPWLGVHVFFAWFAYSAFALATALGVLYLLKKKQAAQGEESPFFKKIPSLGVLEDFTFGVISFGFLNQTIMLISGSIWAKSLWGKYWGWDPIETWAFICWLAYGLYLHLRTNWKLKGQFMAWYAILALSTALVSAWAVGYLDSFHKFLTS